MSERKSRTSFSGLLGTSSKGTPDTNPQGLSGSLTLYVVGAENLAAPSATTKMTGDGCDPYCTFRAGNAKTKTSVRKRTTQPLWREVLTIDSVTGADNLDITVKHFSRFQAPKPLGRGHLDLHTVIDGGEHDLWVDLEPQGRVHLSVKFEDATCLFGLPLGDACAREGRDVPLIVTRCIDEIQSRGMNDVGIYRVSGKQQIMAKLRQAFIMDPSSAQLDRKMAPNISSVASCLKLYLRELPEPLFTSQLYPSFMKAASMDSTREKRIEFFRATLDVLPKPNYDTIVFLMNHLCKVLEHSEKNKMSSSALATCFGPSLLTPADEDDETTTSTMNVFNENACLQFLLENWQEIIKPKPKKTTKSPNLPRPSVNDTAKRLQQMQTQQTQQPQQQQFLESRERSPSQAKRSIRSPSIVRRAQTLSKPDNTPRERSPSMGRRGTTTSARVQNLVKLLESGRRDSDARPAPVGPLKPTSRKDELAQAFAQFDTKKTGKLSKEQFKELAQFMGAETLITRVHRPEITLELFIELMEEEQLEEAKRTARARAQSVVVKKRWHAKKLAQPPRVQVKLGFNKKPLLNCGDFKQLCYQTGYFSSEEEFKAIDKSGRGNITSHEFTKWWDKNVQPLLKSAFTTPQRYRAFTQAIHYFQDYDPKAEGAISIQDFSSLHGDIGGYGYSHIDDDPQECLEQIETLNGTVSFNKYVNWLLRRNCLDLDANDSD